MTFRLVAGCLAAVTTVVVAQQQPPAAPDFETWLDGVRVEALERGISAETIALALSDIDEPEPTVVAQDRAQPEHVQTLDDYLRQRLSTRTVSSARTRFAQHKTLLSRINAEYGVSPSITVAVWGLESNFGRITGTRPIITALTTLAFDPRRSGLFRRELFHALTIIDEGHITLDELKGSWAGAMGQPQFMPSSYLEHAVDFDADGRADIWKSEADVFASIANYLKNAGWVSGERWGRQVRVSTAAMERIGSTVPMRTTGCRAVRDMTEARPLSEWTRLGVVLTTGAALPVADMDASLVRGDRQNFLVYRNYHALIDYNCSHSYALSVGLLADRVW